MDNNKEEERSKQRALKLHRVYVSAFETKDGKEVLKDLVRAALFTTPSVDFTNPNPLTMAFNDGQKYIVHRILSVINTDPEQYIKLMNTIQEEEDDFGFEH